MESKKQIPDHLFRVISQNYDATGEQIQFLRQMRIDWVTNQWITMQWFHKRRSTMGLWKPTDLDTNND